MGTSRGPGRITVSWGSWVCRAGSEPVKLNAPSVGLSLWCGGPAADIGAMLEQ
jgi:hypothetical protein